MVGRDGFEGCERAVSQCFFPKKASADDEDDSNTFLDEKGMIKT